MNPIILGFADGSMFFVVLLLTTVSLWLLIHVPGPLRCPGIFIFDAAG
ncbi:MAG: hypothetical protein WCH98_06935 [Verrucomicrobiota bacterium]